MPPSPPPSPHAIFTPCRRSHDARNGKSGSSYSSHPRSGSSTTSCPRGPYNYMPYERILPVCSAWKPPTNASAPGSRSANIFYSLVVALAQIPGKDACALSKNPPLADVPLPSAPFCLSFPFVCHSRRESAFLTTFHESLTTRLPYRLDFSNCRACSKLVSVSFAPLRPHHMKT